MARRVNLVVTCTDRKTVAAAPELRASALPKGDVAARSRAWLERLETASIPAVQAADLYRGEHWSIVLGLYEAARTQRMEASVWVASAGYGLIALDSPIKPYAATFSARAVDVVVGSNESSRSWWDSLSGWEGPEPGSPRSVSDLARVFPGAPLLVAASKPYIEAMAGDLARARDALQEPECLSIFSAGARLHGLSDNIVPTSARLRQSLKGSLHSLNARCMERAVRELSLSALQAPELRAFFEKETERLPKLTTPDRTKTTDEEVINFIRRELDANPKARHSPLLRRFRDEGRACEQSRFAQLFARAAAQRSDNGGEQDARP